MRKTAIYIALVILTLSCKKSDVLNCEDKIADQGLIAESVDFSACVYTLANNNFIIKDSVDYAILQKEITDQNEYYDCSFPEIDFEQYTLLGQFASAGGCTVNFNRSVTADSTAKSVLYKIDVKACGDCDMLGYSYNFVLVSPKISDDYSIDFKTE